MNKVLKLKSLPILIILLVLSCSGYKNLNPDSSTEITADDFLYHINYLASDELEGRKPASKGDTLAFTYISEEFKRMGLLPIIGNSYLQEFEFTGGIKTGDNNTISLLTNGGERKLILTTDFIPASQSASKSAEGEIIFAGYGISAADLNYDDYKNIDVSDKMIMIFSGFPENDKKDFGEYSLTRKIVDARTKGVKGIIIIPEEENLPVLRYSEGSGSSGLPIVYLSPGTVKEIFEAEGKNIENIKNQTDTHLEPASFRIKNTTVKLKIDLLVLRKKTFNVAGYIEGKDSDKKDEVIIVGAHYDHLGFGGSGSLGNFGEIHNGADDNASGVAGVLEAAQYLVSKELNRTVLFMAFGAEELGILGSNYYVNNPVFPIEKTAAMINLDMIGRMKDKRLILNGAGTSTVWKEMANRINGNFGFELAFNEGGFGGSDQAAFYGKNLPVLFFFTGTHTDYHKPSDDVDKINPEDGAEIVKFLAETILEIDRMDTKPEYVKVREEPRRTMRRDMVTMGVVPDFTPSDGFKISAVREGRPAAKAGLKGGDVIMKIGDKQIKNIQEYMAALQSLKKGETKTVEVKRNSKILKFEVKF